MNGNRSTKWLLASALLLASGTVAAGGQASAAVKDANVSAEGETSAAGTGTGASIPAEGQASAAEAADHAAAGGEVPPMLDPGFGYFSHYMRGLAEDLLAESPVTAYLPTRLPDTGWQYYGLNSSLSDGGYAIAAFRTAAAQPARAALPGKGGEAPADPAALLYRLKAGTAADAKLSVPPTAKQLHSADDWTYWADGTSAQSAAALTAKFAAAAKPGEPVSGTSGTVLAEQKDGRTVYSASWTVDGSTYYSFVCYGSLTDFTSMLTSFRPVVNLLDSADVVLLPKDLQLNMQIGRGQLYEPYENKFVDLSKPPAVYGGSAYLPLRDIATVIGGQIQYASDEHAVYVSQNGNINELRLDLQSGGVTRGKEQLGKVDIVVKNGTTLVPLRFMTDRFLLPVEYDAASKRITVHDRKWGVSYDLPPTADKADWPVSVFTVAGPPFLYANNRLPTGSGSSFAQHGGPSGYSGLNYQIDDISIPLLPGDNELLLRDIQEEKRILADIPVEAAVKPEDIPFRYGGLPVFDGIDLHLKLASGDGKSWPAGYAETSGTVVLSGEADFGAMKIDSLQIGYKIGDFSSQPAAAPVKDGKLSYTLTPDKGPGAYVVTVYAKDVMPNAELAPIVSFIVVVP